VSNSPWKTLRRPWQLCTEMRKVNADGCTKEESYTIRYQRDARQAEKSDVWERDHYAMPPEAECYWLVVSRTFPSRGECNVFDSARGSWERSIPFWSGGQRTQSSRGSTFDSISLLVLRTNHNLVYVSGSKPSLTSPSSMAKGGYSSSSSVPRVWLYNSYGLSSSDHYISLHTSRQETICPCRTLGKTSG